jgi:hypothetical protein
MSSLFDSPELLEQLLKITGAQTKVAQTAPSPANSLEHFDTAQKLIKNLQQQTTGKDIFTSERDNADVRATHLQNFDALLNFLSFNKIVHNGKQIVIKENQEKSEYIKNNDAAASGYIEYPETGPQLEYYINKDGLIAYLRDLQSKNNPLLNAMISARINDVNSTLNLNIPHEAPKKTPGVITDQVNSPQYSASHEVVNQNQNEKAKNQQLILSQVMQTLPFDVHDINIKRINDFFRLYSQLMSESQSDAGRVSVVQGAIAQATALMSDLNNYTQAQINSYQMDNLNEITAEGWAKAPAVRNTLPILDHLVRIIRNTYTVVRDLYDAYAVTGKVDKNIVAQQILNDSKYNYNLTALQSTMKALELKYTSKLNKT